MRVLDRRVLPVPVYLVLIMCATKEYTADMHRTRYAAWAASRAIGRGASGISTARVFRAMERVDLEGRLKTTVFSSRAAYDKWHVGMVERIQKAAVSEGMQLTFGLASKVLAIHIKTLHIIVGKRKDLLRFAHPPVDRIVLKKGLPKDLRNNLTLLGWTHFSREDYRRVFKALEEHVLDSNQPRWKIEACWMNEFL